MGESKKKKIPRNFKIGGLDVTWFDLKPMDETWALQVPPRGLEWFTWRVSLRVEWQPHKSHHHQIRKASNKLVIDSSGFRWEREHVTAGGTVRVCHPVCVRGGNPPGSDFWYWLMSWIWLFFLCATHSQWSQRATPAPHSIHWSNQWASHAKHALDSVDSSYSSLASPDWFPRENNSRLIKNSKSFIGRKSEHGATKPVTMIHSKRDPFTKCFNQKK